MTTVTMCRGGDHAQPAVIGPHLHWNGAFYAICHAGADCMTPSCHPASGQPGHDADQDREEREQELVAALDRAVADAPDEWLPHLREIAMEWVQRRFGYSPAELALTDVPGKFLNALTRLDVVLLDDVPDELWPGLLAYPDGIMAGWARGKLDQSPTYQAGVAQWAADAARREAAAHCDQVIGKYVTAYASDLADEALVGKRVVVRGTYLRWDDNAEVEVCADSTGSFRVRPDPRNRVGSAGPDDKVFLGTVVAPGTIEEMHWWATLDVLQMSLPEFANRIGEAKGEPFDGDSRPARVTSTPMQ